MTPTREAAIEKIMMIGQDQEDESSNNINDKNKRNSNHCQLNNSIRSNDTLPDHQNNASYRLECRSISPHNSSTDLKMLPLPSIQDTEQFTVDTHNAIEKASVGINTTVIDHETKTKSSPFLQHEGQRRRIVKPMNPNDITDFKSRLAKLEKLMHIVASKEDFEAAAQIKAFVVEINKVLGNLQKLHKDMRRAAESEDYAEASQIKAKRDDEHSSVLNALIEAEKNFDSLRGVLQTSRENHLTQQKDRESRINLDHFDDLSLSTIRRLEDDDPSIAMTMTGRSFQLNADDREILPRHDSSNSSPESHIIEGAIDIHDQQILENDELTENGEHPLQGVPNYENLPQPEEGFHQSETGLIINLNTSNSQTSTDSISKIQSILGTYRTRCFLSKNWSLREAAILKLSLMLPSIIAKFKEENENWWDSFSRCICVILEKAVDDNIVQVFLTGLILLDDCVNEIETAKITQKETISLLSNVIINLVDKISSANPKVAEGAETALMSLALFTGIGPSYIGSQLMKRMSSKESKGKLVCARFRLLRYIVNEFENEAPGLEQIMEFVQKYGFGHKDVDVREAAKELSTEMFLRDGKRVITMLDELSERQLKEYMVSFSNAKQKRQHNLNERKSPIRDFQSNSWDKSTAITRLLTPNGLDDHKPASTPRGRGRGRGRILQ